VEFFATQLKPKNGKKHLQTFGSVFSFWGGEVLKTRLQWMGVWLMSWRITLIHCAVFNLYTNRELAGRKFWSG
jgi:hypothetical protein